MIGIYPPYAVVRNADSGELELRHDGIYLATVGSYLEAEAAIREIELEAEYDAQRSPDEYSQPEPQANPTDTGFRAADFRQQCAATMQAHEDAVRAGDVITFHRWKGARGRSRAKVWTGTVVKPLKLRVRVQLNMGGFMEVDRRDVIGRKAA